METILYILAALGGLWLLMFVAGFFTAKHEINNPKWHTAIPNKQDDCVALSEGSIWWIGERPVMGTLALMPRINMRWIKPEHASPRAVITLSEMPQEIKGATIEWRKPGWGSREDTDKREKMSLVIDRLQITPNGEGCFVHLGDAQDINSRAASPRYISAEVVLDVVPATGDRTQLHFFWNLDGVAAALEEITVRVIAEDQKRGDSGYSPQGATSR